MERLEELEIRLQELEAQNGNGDLALPSNSLLVQYIRCDWCGMMYKEGSIHACAAARTITWAEK